MSKCFTVWEAEQLLPQIREWIREAMALKAKFDEAQHSMDSFSQRIMLMGGTVVDRRDAVEVKKRRQSSGELASRRFRNSYCSIQVEMLLAC